MKYKRIAIVIGAATICVLGVFAVLLHRALQPFAERARHADAAFTPLTDLRIGSLENGFGVYYLCFGDTCLLNDDNIDRIKTINRLPLQYDLTVEIGTKAVTDRSIPVIADLKSIDYLIVGESGISDVGLQRLADRMPGTTVQQRNSSRKPTKPGG
ncbi:MAG: hypothetical protein ACF788_03660 [Novipirellula sp. JB048]